MEVFEDKNKQYRKQLTELGGNKVLRSRPHAAMFVVSFATGSANFKVAPYSCTIVRALRTKAQIICARSKENVSVVEFSTLGIYFGSLAFLQEYVLCFFRPRAHYNFACGLIF